MSQTVPLSVEELTDTYGVLFIGYAFSMIVYGFTLFQTYVYFSQYGHDHYVIKSTVGALCLLDSFNFGLTTHALYFYLILSYPDTPPLSDFTYTYCAGIGVSVLAIFIVQIFYSHRIWIASQNTPVAVGIAVISFAAFALGIALTGIITKTLVLSSLTTPELKAIMGSSQGLTFLSGVATFVALNFFSPPQNPAVKLTTRLYNIVVGYGITRGFFATTIQFGCFITFLSASSQAFWMPFHLVASRVFINSLLTTLNIREVHRGQGVNEDINSRKTDTTSSSSIPHPRLHSNIRFAVSETSRPGINVVRTEVNGTTTSKVILEENEENEANDQLKRTDSKV